MDLSAPLSSLIPSLDAATLEVLAGSESAFSVTAITRLARRGTRQGHMLVLERLVRDGLVLASPANRGAMYRLNRAHLLAPMIVEAVQLRGRIIQELSEAVATLRPQPLHASVFGSFARREAGPHSDIDLLLLAPDDMDHASWPAQIDALGAQLQAMTGNRLQCIDLTRTDLDRVVEAEEPILEQWRRDGITLLGPSLQEVIRVASEH